MSDGKASGQAWAQNARPLAEWVDSHLVNRRDAFGHYLPVRARKPKQTAITDKSGLTVEIIERHFVGRDHGDIIGLHSTARDEAGAGGETACCWSRWLAIDIDRHDETIDAGKTCEAALTWWRRARQAGFHPLLFDSDGRGGFHLLIVFRASVATERVFGFGKWLTADWEQLGLEEAPEIFPKQPALARGKGFGNWLRLPGRHHTREHWSRLWSGEHWMSGEEAVDAITAIQGDAAERIPDDAIEAAERRTSGARSELLTLTLSDAELAKSALESLSGMVSGYSDWIKVGMCLKSLGAEGLALWDYWSSGDPSKYDRNACVEKWATFDAGGSGEVGLGTLFYLAEQAGWKRPKGGATKNPAEANGNGHAEGNGIIPRRIQAPPAGHETFKLTDMGNAERFVARHGRDLHYVPAWEKWLVWDGRRWAPDNLEAVRKKAKETVRSIYGDAAAHLEGDELKEAVQWAFKCENVTRFDAMIKMCRSESNVPVAPERLDKQPWVLNVLNGSIDLRSGVLGPHLRDELITQLCEVEYDPHAACPLWIETLDLVFGGNPNLISYWQTLCGLTLTGVVSEQYLPILHGSGSNGKGTVVNTIMNMLGTDYAFKAPPDLLMAKRGNEHPTERASLFGKRLVVAIETAEGARLDEAMIKELTGSDPISARRMREDFWQFDPTHKTWLVTNHKPVVRGTDHAIWRRLRLVPFVVTIEESKAVKDMPEQLAAEYPGILAWCIRGCLEWQRAGRLEAPEEVSAATSEYRESEDALRAFIEECAETGKAFDESASLMYLGYHLWAKESGEQPVSQRRFGPAMVDRGFTRYKDSVKRYRGIKLREEFKFQVERKRNALRDQRDQRD